MQSSQLGIFGRSSPEIDPAFARLHRVRLDADAWYEYTPGWLQGHELVFEQLVRSIRWRHERQHIYDKVVDTPRLVARLPQDGEFPAVVEQMRELLSTRYGQTLTNVSLGYYRDGHDSVAFHGDRVAREMAEALVCTVSVGAPRRFLLRPRAGGTLIALSLGWGDLFVMGGSCQRTWQHGIPKVKSAPPRIAIMFRPDWFDYA